MRIILLAVVAMAAAALGAVVAVAATSPGAAARPACHRAVAGPLPSPASAFDRAVEHAPPICG